MVHISKKIFLWIRVILPFLLNVPLFLIICNSQTGAEYMLTNTLFYQGVINVVFGTTILFLASRSTSIFNQGKYASIMRSNLIIKDQEPKHYNRDGGMDGPLVSSKSNYLKLIYMFIGFAFFVAAIISL